MKNKPKHSFFLPFFLVLILFLNSASLGFSDDEELFSRELPAWLERINFGLTAGTDQKPHYYFETVQPLYQDEDKQNTVFIQPRVSYLDVKGAYNLGLGYRKLFNDNTVLLGGNFFFDYQTHHKHYRGGLGLEAFFHQVEMRSNAYFGMSPQRTIKQSGAQSQYEKAVDGIDFEVGGPLPYINWIKFYGGGYWYDYKKFEDKSGWQTRTEIQPFDCLTLNFITYDDNKGSQEYKVDVGVSIPFGPQKGGRIKNNIKISPYAYASKADHSNRVLQRVERNYEIEVERYVQTASATIEIRRGD